MASTSTNIAIQWALAPPVFIKLPTYQEYLNSNSNSWPSQPSSGVFPSGLLFISQLGSHAMPLVVVPVSSNPGITDKPGHINGLSIQPQSWNCLIKRLDSGARLPCRLSPIAQHHWVIGSKGLSRLSFVYCDGKCGCSADHDTIGLAGCCSQSIAADRLPAINDKMRRDW